MKCKRLGNYTLLIAFILALNGVFEASASNETEKVVIISRKTIKLQVTEKLHDQIKNDANKTQESEEHIPNSCKAFADTVGVNEIQVPGMKPFQVLCSDDSPAGSGWTIIQQRIDGQENFQRNWSTYSEGFGSFNGDFFLGLTKIHHITHSQRYELYIYMEKFNNEWSFARYDNFRVGSENDLFELQSLGAFNGTHMYFDNLRWLEHIKFTTYDRDNDKWEDGNCAKDHLSGGWWYNSCTLCNLNGIYFQTEVGDKRCIHWYHRKSLKKVQMLIRPMN